MAAVLAAQHGWSSFCPDSGPGCGLRTSGWAASKRKRLGTWSGGYSGIPFSTASTIASYG